MSEKITKIEKEDIKPPAIEPGGTAIIFQRHERYQRDRDAENSGSLITEDAEAARKRYDQFFEEELDMEGDVETMVLFVSSDTQYNGGGRRSLETAQLAQDAAIEVMQARGIDPKERIINLNSQFTTRGFEPTEQSIRPMTHIREPQIFATPEYVKYLQDKYGSADGKGNGLSPRAWAAHEEDAEKEVREAMGAEGVREMVVRTKTALKVLERYAKAFHKTHPNKRLIIWTASHYDTTSPLVKDATGTNIEEYVPVDYGAGVVIDLPPNSGEVYLSAQGERVKLDLGRRSVENVLKSSTLV